jgi:hypothetical protein
MITPQGRSQGRYAAQWKVESLTGRIDKKTGEIAKYTVSRLFDETWQCGCWAWIRWHNRPDRPDTFNENGDCKHIIFVQDSNLKPAKEVIEGQEIVEHEGYKITRPKGFDARVFALKLELKVSTIAAEPKPKRRSTKRTGVTS